MVRYRRYYIPGGIYFFTVTLQDRQSNMLTKYIKHLGEAMRQVKKTHPYKTLALVVLPDHLHVMWELPDGDVNYSVCWRFIKSFFASNLRKAGILIDKNIYGENILWQRRFWEHTIRNEKDYEKHFDYIHFNPVKHGLVKRVSDWPFSTFHRYVQNGYLPKDWSYQNDDLDVE